MRLDEIVSPPPARETGGSSAIMQVYDTSASQTFGKIHQYSTLVSACFQRRNPITGPIDRGVENALCNGGIMLTPDLVRVRIYRQDAERVTPPLNADDLVAKAGN